MKCKCGQFINLCQFIVSKKSCHLFYLKKWTYWWAMEVIMGLFNTHLFAYIVFFFFVIHRWKACKCWRHTSALPSTGYRWSWKVSVKANHYLLCPNTSLSLKHLGQCHCTFLASDKLYNTKDTRCAECLISISKRWGITVIGFSYLRRWEWERMGINL